jgi:cell division protein FtsB
MSRVLTIAFAGLILLLQYPLWLGKGGWMRVWDLDRQLGAQQKVNEDLQKRNNGLEAEVRDLKNGLGAIEERARFELGMIKEDEIFFQVLETPRAPVPPKAAPQ